ncbi:MAG: tRNA (adenosine(37)-N6)-threonylcarbamoyltransferase complex dimerization subunit type 1 TsaB [Clostridia bacterium]|jgi:tRNA threonylcarbamoyladenosine biosynthesis protein TsaB|nr:tRNA (adenosine(37)-N6)-threonylcarbamoyltransferase complex dimerization subunit type 1 TsaB [Clostridia bacterium]
MKILSIETSCDILTVSLLEDDNLILELKEETPKKHSEVLMPLIDKLLKEADTNLDNIDLFACDNGPGSFTGIRIRSFNYKSFL